MISMDFPIDSYFIYRDFRVRVLFVEILRPVDTEWGYVDDNLRPPLLCQSTRTVYEPALLETLPLQSDHCWQKPVHQGYLCFIRYQCIAAAEAHGIALPPSLPSHISAEAYMEMLCSKDAEIRQWAILNPDVVEEAA